MVAHQLEAVVVLAVVETVLVGIHLLPHKTAQQILAAVVVVIGLLEQMVMVALEL